MKCSSNDFSHWLQQQFAGQKFISHHGGQNQLVHKKKRGHVHGSGLESVGVCQKEEEGENRGQPRPVGSMLLRAAYT